MSVSIPVSIIGHTSVLRANPAQSEDRLGSLVPALAQSGFGDIKFGHAEYATLGHPQDWA